MLASKLEFHIKKTLTKQQKEELICKPEKLAEYLGDKIESDCYQKIKVEKVKI